MSEIAQSYDVVVVGAGPTGCAAAAGYAQRGSRVLLLEANPKASKRFAGEWVHPYGAAVLERLGLMPHEASADHIPCYGFAVFPDDTTDPIRLEYTNGVGFSGEHADIVQGLRDRAAGLDPVTYLERARVTALTDDTVTFSHARAEHTVHARLIVGADGRSSIVRKSLRADEELEADLVSHMAGLELHDVELPFEGYGHVLLGGPGPVLLYRIGERTIRACVDLPVDAPGARRDARFLWDGFASRFPAALRGAFKRALETQKLVWAANRFLPRTFYGRGSTALLGDAVGFYHPLTASGISVGVKDCEALLAAPSVAAYQRTREGQSYVPELLANALYQVFQREDDAAAAIRRAVFDTWRDHPEERDRTMRILGGEELRLGQFAGAFVRVAGRAVTDLAKEQGLGGAAQDLRHFLEFAQWPGASVMPAALRRRYRRDSDNLAPLRALGIRPRGPELPGARAFRDSIHVDVDALLAKVTDAPDLAGASPVQRAAADLEEVTAEGDLKRAVRLAQRLQEAPAA
ncbi:MAG TPA: FAD-dependent oxidoreductase, partial [Polyangiaceae bacterium LLY-WYZ-15_(1-7)]|nr:FAD-dependent oxidoreductase [Polyangiaceae bacterium LLY-WYZ-15_(1-7)]